MNKVRQLVRDKIIWISQNSSMQKLLIAKNTVVGGKNMDSSK